MKRGDEIKYWSPRDIRPYSKACPRKMAHAKNKQHTMILTNTPVKQALEAKEALKKRSMSGTVKRKLPMPIKRSPIKTYGKKVQLQTQPSDSEEDSITYTDESESEIDECQTLDEPVMRDPTLDNITEGDFILDTYATKKSKKYFVGQVLDKDDSDDNVEVKFLTRKPQKDTHRFVFPDKEDIDNIPIEDIAMILPQPTTVGGTKRASKQYIFDTDLSKFF